jgi:hypothetical protein
MNGFCHQVAVNLMLMIVVGICWVIPAGAAAPEEIASRLQKAREELRISEATERRIAAELQRLKNSDYPSPDTVADYEIYLERVHAMVVESRQRVADMEAAYAEYAAQTNSRQPPAGNELDKRLHPSIPETQSSDTVASLDRELNASLADFDEMLLQELEAIRSKSAERMRDMAQEAAEAAKRLRDKGVDLGDSESSADEEPERPKDEPSGSPGSPDEDPEEGEKAGPRKTDQARTDEEGRSGTQTRESGAGASTNGSRADTGGDDDIVARQLREAAENETDPELKEKLWKEYDEYKKNQQTSTDP